MQYEDALKEWGARRLERGRKIDVVRSTVEVQMDFDEGFSLGYLAEGEYDSYAEAPSASVRITGIDSKGRTCETSIDHDLFNFALILREIVEAAEGAVTA